MDMTLQETNEFPFHDILVKYLDTRAPLPSNVLLYLVTVMKSLPKDHAFYNYFSAPLKMYIPIIYQLMATVFVVAALK